MLAQSNYKRSNAILTIDFDVSEFGQHTAREILASSSAEDRQRFGDDLLDDLADQAMIDICNLKVSDAKQYHKRRGKRVSMRRYGYYKPATKYIYITNRTAVRGQILAPKSFLDTLLHEWMHHYDFCKLNLNSIHTKGFYARIKDLSQKLINA